MRTMMGRRYCRCDHFQLSSVHGLIIINGQPPFLMYDSFISLYSDPSSKILLQPSIDLLKMSRNYLPNSTPLLQVLFLQNTVMARLLNAPKYSPKSRSILVICCQNCSKLLQRTIQRNYLLRET